MLTSEIKVTKYHNQNMDVPLNDIALKVHKHTKYEIKVQSFFKFLVCCQFSSLIFIICADKRSGGCKISSYGISLKCSRYQDTRPTDSSLLIIQAGPLHRLIVTL